MDTNTLSLRNIVRRGGNDNSSTGDWHEIKENISTELMCVCVCMRQRERQREDEEVHSIEVKQTAEMCDGRVRV